MTQEAPQKISDMLRMTVDNATDFYHQIANHIDNLESKITILEDKIAEYQELKEKEDDDHK